MRADGLAIEGVVATVRHECRGAGFRWRRDGHTLIASAPSVASASQLQACVEMLGIEGIRAHAEGDEMHVDLLWCPAGASLKARLALVDAFVAHASDRARGDKRHSKRVDYFAAEARDGVIGLTFANLREAARRRLPARYWPPGIAI